MSAVRAARRRRIPVLACGISLVLGLAGCGISNDPPTSENNGVYVTAGPLTYQLQISRLLNPYAVEDSQYVTGLPPGTSPKLKPGQLWYGVFLWAKNQTKLPETTNQNFDIVDTDHDHYHPLALNPTLNPYAFTAQSLPPGGTQPAPDTTASFGPVQGSLLLFRLPISVYDNRPLTLEIRGPTGKVWATISLDL